MAKGTKESDFEEDMVKYMSASHPDRWGDYEYKVSSLYDKELCMIPDDLINFIKSTQPKEYEALQKQYGTLTNQKIAERTAKSVSDNKTLKTLRKGIRTGGQKLNLVYFKPNHDRSPEHHENYQKNILSVVRQLHYSARNENSLDVVLFVNGLPVVTMELKNALTGQYLAQAIRQYKEDRDPNEKLFEFQRCIVHFAVSTEKVAMTTRLAGKSTYFLPFNKSLENKNEDGFATSYLWEDVLTRDSLLDLIQNYCGLQVNEEKYFDPRTQGLTVKKSNVLIFPRYHQRRVVQRLLADVGEKGVGQKYLIQHSAGSGKSNSIAWLAHRLSDFYQKPSDKKSLFDTVVVVTDRKVLNNQIQDTIKQFEQVPGSIAYIGNDKTSQDLKNALEQNYRMIITTLQKFPVISDSIAGFKDKNFAVIIDEAHSSQTGEAARHLRKALSLEEAAFADPAGKTLDDIILEEINKKGDQSNVSFFAFTATPKNKTMEMFGTTDAAGNKHPFDVYTMEQAIKEGFILDVLKNYMSWQRYYKLIKRSNVEDKEYEKKKTVRLLSNFVDLQDHAIEKKARVMLEHFVAHTQNQIQGKARAMLVTKSRLHAVRFKRKFDEIMREMNLPYGALVAFSGTVTDSETGMDYTEVNMNELQGKVSITEALKMPQFRILIVANKFQTGFDEPMLHTMFVDKKLGDAASVQTLSRLNRTAKGKDSTMVLDFVNDPEDIQEDFQKYYGSNQMEFEDQTDPDSLYDVLNLIEDTHIIYHDDLESFAKYFFKKGDHKQRLQPILNQIVGRFKELPEEEKPKLKGNIKTFVRLYRFLAQIISFSDVELEKYYVLLSALQKKLPYENVSMPLEVLEDVELESYKLQHKYTTDLELESGHGGLKGQTPGAVGGKLEDEMEFLTKIIKTLNDTFGLDLTEDDRVDFMKVKENVETNTELISFFNPQNTRANIEDKFNDAIDDELLNFVNNKLDLYNKLTENKVNSLFKKMWFNEMYDRVMRGR